MQSLETIDGTRAEEGTMKRARGDAPVELDDVAMDGRRRGAPCAALPARGPANANGIDRPVTDNRTAYWTTIPARRTALQVGAATRAAACQDTLVHWTPISLIAGQKEAFIGVL